MVGKIKTFNKHREKFLQIKNKLLSGDFKIQLREFEKSLQNLIAEYDTSNRENRFVVGGAVEILFCALLNSLGFKTEWIKEEVRYDIKIDNLPFSLKSNFTGSGDIRLINILGKTKVVWQEPTIFFISNLGIFYGDPKMGLKTKHLKDALVLNIKEIKLLCEKDSKFIIPILIPKKQSNSTIIRTASYDVAKSVLEKIKSEYLIKFLPK